MVSGLFGHIEVERTRGFAEGVEQRLGRPPIICDTSGVRDDKARKEMMAEFLRENKPDGILATEAASAHLLSFAAEMTGLRSPEDLAIIGFDCFSFKSARNQVVSAISTSWWHAGRIAAQSIVDIVQSGTQWDEPRKLDPRFVPGDTTPPELSTEDDARWLLQSPVGRPDLPAAKHHE